MILQILKVVGCIGTIGTGLLAALRPSALPGFTGLETPGPRGVTEIRSIFGGLFIGVGAFPLIVGVPATYHMLGVMYLAIGAVRLVSMLIDGSLSESSNIISLAVEIVFGVVLVL
ncbi:MAG: DUF4345 family protein [Anaerolineae bacterium]|jgi:hypothetical protein